MRFRLVLNSQTNSSITVLFRDFNWKFFFFWFLQHDRYNAIAAYWVYFSIINFWNNAILMRKTLATKLIIIFRWYYNVLFTLLLFSDADIQYICNGLIELAYRNWILE